MLSSQSNMESKFTICEICDCYLDQSEKLSSHMSLAHGIKINPMKSEYNPPLKCPSCSWRYYTDHGLERHLLGMHGLVSSNLLDLAGNDKDSGRCSICGHYEACGLVQHTKEAHKVDLKQARLSYECSVCIANFNSFGLFQQHVSSIHNDLIQAALKKKK